MILSYGNLWDNPINGGLYCLVRNRPIYTNNWWHVATKLPTLVMHFGWLVQLNTLVNIGYIHRYIYLLVDCIHGIL